MLVTHRRAVRALGRARPRRPPRRRAPTTSTPPASRPSSARSSSATAPPPSRQGCGDAHRVRLRLGAGQPRRRARARAGRATRPRASTPATSSPATAGSMSGGTRASLAGRDGGARRSPSATGACSTRARGAAHALASGRRQGAGRRLGRQLGALRAAAPGAAAPRGQLPTWAGSAPRRARCRCSPAGTARRHEGARRRAGSGTRPPARLVKGSTGGPDAAARAEVRLPHRRDRLRRRGPRALSEVHVTGVDGYTFTGRILAWGAERAAAGGLQGTGALGPADGFGLEALIDGCAPGRHRRGGRRTAGRPPQRTRPPADAAACGCSRDPAARRRLARARRRGAARARGRGRGRAPAVGDDDVRLGRSAPAARRSAAASCAGGRPPQPAPAGRPAARLELRRHDACPPTSGARLRAGETAGVILFGRNGGDAGQWRALTRLAPATRRGGGALVVVDQEGGDIRTRAVRRAGAGAAGAGRPGRGAGSSPAARQPSCARSGST